MRAPDLKLLYGHESFHAVGNSLGLTLLDYWRWSGSDLLDNTERGVLAEFLVAKALGVADEPRVEWAAHDVSASFDGKDVAVEVKSAAWYQSWDRHQAQPSPSDIRFDIAPRKWSWDPKTNESIELLEPQRAADVYVFCVLGNDDGSKPNPFDLDQWKFYVLDTASLDRERPKQKTIGLKPLCHLVQKATGRDAVEYADLREAIRDRFA